MVIRRRAIQTLFVVKAWGVMEMSSCPRSSEESPDFCICISFVEKVSGRWTGGSKGCVWVLPQFALYFTGYDFSSSQRPRTCGPRACKELRTCEELRPC